MGSFKFQDTVRTRNEKLPCTGVASHPARLWLVRQTRLKKEEADAQVHQYAQQLSQQRDDAGGYYLFMGVGEGFVTGFDLDTDFFDGFDFGGGGGDGGFFDIDIDLDF